MCSGDADPMRIQPLPLAILLLAATTPAAAQSQNVPLITATLMEEVCVPFVETGDMAAAIRAGQAEGYRIVEQSPDNQARATDPDAPPAWVEMARSQSGRFILSKRWARGYCAIGLAEGGIARIDRAAEPSLTALGMTRVLNAPEGPTGIVVWRSEGRQAVIAGSPHAVPGVELTVSFDTGWKSGD